MLINTLLLAFILVVIYIYLPVHLAYPSAPTIHSVMVGCEGVNAYAMTAAVSSAARRIELGCVGLRVAAAHHGDHGQDAAIEVIPLPKNGNTDYWGSVLDIARLVAHSGLNDSDNKCHLLARNTDDNVESI